MGVLPGIGPALTVALLLPATYGLDPTSAFIMFAGIYYGGMYGGSTTSILLNTPGESATIVTALEGHQMARSGRAGAALATAAIGSFVAGTLGTLALTFSAPALAQLALSFGPADYFALIVLAFAATASLLGASPMAGLLSLSIGAILGLVGIDRLSGEARLTFGRGERHPLDGLDPTIVAIGLFAVGETLTLATAPPGTSTVLPLERTPWMTRQDWARSWRPWLRGTAIGFPLGALPAGGAELPTLLSYAVEKRLSRHPDDFGRGAIEGVAGPEAANNASAAGTLVPLLTLGLPASATAAVLLAGFQQFGLQAGPLLFQNEPRFVWTLLASLYVGKRVLLLGTNLPLIRLWVLLLRDPDAAALRRHPGGGHRWRLDRASLGRRFRSPGGDWRPGLRAAASRLPAGAGDDWGDARPGRRHAPAPGLGDCRGELDRPRLAAARGLAPGHCGTGAVVARHRQSLDGQSGSGRVAAKRLD